MPQHKVFWRLQTKAPQKNPYPRTSFAKEPRAYKVARTRGRSGRKRGGTSLPRPGETSQVTSYVPAACSRCRGKVAKSDLTMASSASPFAGV